MYLTGAIIMAYNLWMTVRKGAATQQAPAMAPAE
jgi:cytochrome c oxidase cbb3-type subunit 1